MAETTIFTLPKEVRPEYTQRYTVPVRSDGSIHLDGIKFRANEGGPYDEDTGTPGDANDWVLAVNNPIIDDYTPALYYEFSPVTDIWARVNPRHDKWSGPTTPYFVLGFTEWTTDQAYYGDWWLTGGYVLWCGSDSSAGASIWNVSHTQLSYTAGTPGTYDFYDLHCHFIANDYTGGYGTQSRWLIEAYGVTDGISTKIMEKESSPNGDAHNSIFDSINSIVLFNDYGDISQVGDDLHVVYMDELSVGTTQGGDDLMGLIDFEDGTWGSFTLDPGDTGGSVDSFQVININA